jgi:hypothetical protein
VHCHNCRIAIIAVIDFRIARFRDEIMAILAIPAILAIYRERKEKGDAA